MAVLERIAARNGGIAGKQLQENGTGRRYWLTMEDGGGWFDRSGLYVQNCCVEREYQHLMIMLDGNVV